MKIQVAARTRAPEPVSQAKLDEAIARGEARRKASLQARGVDYIVASRALAIRFADQSAVLLPIKNYPELAQLSSDALASIKVGLAGSALVLKEQDLHVSIAGLVAASKPLMSLVTSVSATRSGSQRTELKAAAARENGKRGGRPKKSREAETPGFA
jgi:hypothetical protein